MIGRCSYIMAIAVVTLGVADCRAELMRFLDREEWFDAAGGEVNVTTIGFSEFPSLTVITDQYEHLGVMFTDGNDTTIGEDFIVYPQDGWGLDGNPEIHLEFSVPVNTIAVDMPGAIRIELFRNAQSLGEELFATPDEFAGLIDDKPFDAAIFRGVGGGGITIDDLHFGFIPAPGTLGVVTCAFFFRLRRRRCAQHYLTGSVNNQKGEPTCTNHVLRFAQRRRCLPLRTSRALNSIA